MELYYHIKNNYSEQYLVSDLKHKPHIDYQNYNVHILQPQQNNLDNLYQVNPVSFLPYMPHSVILHHILYNLEPNMIHMCHLIDLEWIQLHSYGIFRRYRSLHMMVLCTIRMPFHRKLVFQKGYCKLNRNFVNCIPCILALNKPYTFYLLKPAMPKDPDIPSKPQENRNVYILRYHN